MTEKRIMLITGAAGGIGRAAVKVFSENGWRVVGVDRSEYGDAFPKNGLFIHSDISNPDEIKTIYDQARSFSPTLDAVVNNAAIQIAKPLIEPPSKSGTRSWLPTCARFSSARGWRILC